MASVDPRTLTVFDLLHLGDRETCNLPYVERRVIFEHELPVTGPSRRFLRCWPASRRFSRTRQPVPRCAIPPVEVKWLVVRLGVSEEDTLTVGGGPAPELGA
jgi:hypothetical protein